MSLFFLWFLTAKDRELQRSCWFPKHWILEMRNLKKKNLTISECNRKQSAQHKCTGSSQTVGKPGLTIMEMEVKVPLGIIAQINACAFNKCILRFWVANGHNYSTLNHPRSLHSSWSWTQQGSSRTTVQVLASNSSDNTNCTHKHRPCVLLNCNGAMQIPTRIRLIKGVSLSETVIYNEKLSQNKFFWVKKYFPIRSSSMLCFIWGIEMLRLYPQAAFLLSTQIFI